MKAFNFSATIRIIKDNYKTPRVFERIEYRLTFQYLFFTRSSKYLMVLMAFISRFEATQQVRWFSMSFHSGNDLFTAFLFSCLPALSKTSLWYRRFCFNRVAIVENTGSDGGRLHRIKITVYVYNVHSYMFFLKDFIPVARRTEPNLPHYKRICLTICRKIKINIPTYFQYI